MFEQEAYYLAPAKINLFLHVIGRRRDGYHELQTLFQLLDYGDELNFKVNKSGVLALHQSITHRSQQIPMDQNLIIRAANLLREKRGTPNQGVEITLRKKIPVGAGLGGGSSDAGTTLRALNQLWNCNLSTAELSAIGSKLGADVPLFVQGSSAWGEGFGEKLTALKLQASWYLVLTPDCLVSTSEIFSQENLTRNSPAIKMADFMAGQTKTRNDCEPVTRKLFPKVDETLDWLNQYSEARMSGTGSSVFAQFTNEARAREVLGKVPNGATGFVAQGVNSLESSDLKSLVAAK
jgi:4-diphosphocytidyl-2-C-methyl-D-erythritol kinase